MEVRGVTDLLGSTELGGVAELGGGLELRVRCRGAEVLSQGIRRRV